MLLFVGLLMTVGVAKAVVGKACLADSACGLGECCVTAGHIKGKRDATGLCQLMGTETTNQQCYVANRFHFNELYTNRCPCSKGYTCVSSGFIDVPYGMMGTCQQHKKRETSCHNGDDCGSDECCMSRFRPKGRRQMGDGVCTAMGTANSSCLVNYGSAKSHNIQFVCPCESGMTCQPNGQFDISRGPMGNCQRM